MNRNYTSSQIFESKRSSGKNTAGDPLDEGKLEARGLDRNGLEANEGVDSSHYLWSKDMPQLLTAPKAPRSQLALWLRDGFADTKQNHVRQSWQESQTYLHFVDSGKVEDELSGGFENTDSSVFTWVAMLFLLYAILLPIIGFLTES